MRFDEIKRKKLRDTLEEYFDENSLFEHEWESLFADIEEIL